MCYRLAGESTWREVRNNATLTAYNQQCNGTVVEAKGSMVAVGEGNLVEVGEVPASVNSDGDIRTGAPESLMFFEGPPATLAHA